MQFFDLLQRGADKADAAFRTHSRYPAPGLGRVAARAAALEAAARAFEDFARRAAARADATGRGADYRALLQYLERPCETLGHDADGPGTPATPGRRAARATFALVLDSSGVGLRATGRAALHSARDPRGLGDTYTGQGRVGRRDGPAYTTLGAECPAAMTLERMASAAIELSEARAAAKAAASKGAKAFARALGRLARAAAKAEARERHGAAPVEAWRAGMAAAWRVESDARRLADGLPAHFVLRSDARALKAEALAIAAEARAWRRFAAGDARAEYRAGTVARPAWRALAATIKAMAVADRGAAMAEAEAHGRDAARADAAAKAAKAAKAPPAPAPAPIGAVPGIPAALRDAAEELKARAAALHAAGAEARAAAKAAAKAARAAAYNPDAPRRASDRAAAEAAADRAVATWRAAVAEATSDAERAEALELFEAARARRAALRAR